MCISQNFNAWPWKGRCLTTLSLPSCFKESLVNSRTCCYTTRARHEIFTSTRNTCKDWITVTVNTNSKYPGTATPPPRNLPPRKLYLVSPELLLPLTPALLPRPPLESPWTSAPSAVVAADESAESVTAVVLLLTSSQTVPNLINGNQDCTVSARRPRPRACPPVPRRDMWPPLLPGDGAPLPSRAR